MKKIYLLLSILAFVYGCKEDESPYITVPIRNFEVSDNGGTIEIRYSSNAKPKLYYVQEDWIEVYNDNTNPQEGLYKITLGRNLSYDDRAKEFLISVDEGVSGEKITVKQESKKNIIIDKPEYTVDNFGGIMDIEVSSNIEFEVEPNVPWIKYLRTRALTRNTMTFEVDEMFDDERSGRITLYNRERGISTYCQIYQRTNFKLTTTHETAYIGQSKRIEYESEVYSEEDLIWESTDTDVVTVDSRGNIVGKSEGKAFINVSTKDKKYGKVCIVTIESVESKIKFHTSSGWGSYSSSQGGSWTGFILFGYVENNSDADIEVDNLKVYKKSTGELLEQFGPKTIASHDKKYFEYRSPFGNLGKPEYAHLFVFEYTCFGISYTKTIEGYF